MPKIRPIMINVYTDSTASMIVSKKKIIFFTKTSAQNDSDIKAEVQHFYGLLNEIVEIRHVKAHQDRNHKYSTLSFASKLNVLMDKHADKAIS